jgi:SAM-dependent methyltransferase
MRMKERSMGTDQVTPVAEHGAVERLEPGSDMWLHSHGDHVARYLYASEFVRGRNVLDAGTGPGYGAALLMGAGAKSVQAVDIEAASIEVCRSTYKIEGLDFLVDDCETLAAVRGPVDVICSFENIEHLNHPERFLEAASRLLGDDGVLLCSTPDRAADKHQWVDGKPNNPYHINEWYRDEFAELLGRYFGRIDMRSQVTSLALEARRQATDALNEHLTYLWSGPLFRLGRVAGKMLGREQAWPKVMGLASSSPVDYPIVYSGIGPVLGMPSCHYAICRDPRR